MILVSSLFMRIIPTSGSYSALPHHEPSDVTESRRSRRLYNEPDETGTQSTAFEPQPPGHIRSYSEASNVGLAAHGPNTDETSSLVSKVVSRNSVDPFDSVEATAHDDPDSHHPVVRGLALLPRIEFWQLFLIMGLLSGIGLMTIKLVPALSLSFHIK